MGQIARALTRLWAWLSGKKSAIAATANALLMWVVIKHYVDDDTATLLASLLTVWTGVAVGHMAQKASVKP